MGARVGGGSFANNAATHSASAIANAATRSVLTGSNFGDNIIAAIPDVIAQAIGGVIGDAVRAKIDIEAEIIKERLPELVYYSNMNGRDELNDYLLKLFENGEKDLFFVNENLEVVRVTGDDKEFRDKNIRSDMGIQSQKEHPLAKAGEQQVTSPFKPRWGHLSADGKRVEGTIVVFVSEIPGSYHVDMNENLVLKDLYTANQLTADGYGIDFDFRLPDKFERTFGTFSNYSIQVSYVKENYFDVNIHPWDPIATVNPSNKGATGYSRWGSRRPEAWMIVEMHKGAKSTIKHEFYHTIGMKHSNNPKSIMNDGGGTNGRLTDTELKSIVNIYGKK